MGIASVDRWNARGIAGIAFFGVYHVWFEIWVHIAIAARRYPAASKGGVVAIAIRGVDASSVALFGQAQLVVRQGRVKGRVGIAIATLRDLTPGSCVVTSASVTVAGLRVDSLIALLLAAIGVPYEIITTNRVFACALNTIRA